jgi:hypothetical protein
MADGRDIKPKPKPKPDSNVAAKRKPKPKTVDDALPFPPGDPTYKRRPTLDPKFSET